MDRGYLNAVGLNVVGAPVGEGQVSISHRQVLTSPVAYPVNEALTVVIDP
jgi:hypothetical protein